jgi:hypothetical protein
MDFGGNGIVSTECRAVFEGLQAPRVSAAIASDPQDGIPRGDRVANARTVAGAVCVDYALSESATQDLIRKISDEPIAHAVLVDIATSSTGEWIASVRKLKGIATQWTQGSIAKSLVETVAETYRDPEKRRVIQPLKVPHSLPAAFLVPTRIRSDGAYEAILLEVTGVSPFGTRPWPMGLVLLFGGLAIVFLFWGFAASREGARHERLLGRLRSLQTAVIQTDALETITAANDRAEEIIGRQLPTFGLKSGLRLRFWGVFDEKTLLLENSADAVALGIQPRRIIGDG